MTVSQDLVRGSVVPIVLALLNERPMYGYEIVGELRSQTDAVVDLPEGTVYPALRRLERQGLITGRWVETSGAPRRRYYRLTHEGQRSLAAGRSEWRRLVSAAESILNP
jgi:PadR family transcriptional regulator, regulatory protein PadR